MATPTPKLKKDQRIPTELLCVGPPGPVTPMEGNLKATLFGPKRKPLSGQKVLWSTGRADMYVYPPSSTTDKSGNAGSRYIVPWDLGMEWSDTVMATFPGDDNYAPASCQIKVLARSSGLPEPPSVTPLATP